MPYTATFVTLNEGAFRSRFCFLILKRLSIDLFLFLVCRSICRVSGKVNIVPLKSCGILCRSDQACGSQPLLWGGACNGFQ